MASLDDLESVLIGLEKHETVDEVKIDPDRSLEGYEMTLKFIQQAYEDLQADEFCMFREFLRLHKDQNRQESGQPPYQNIFENMLQGFIREEVEISKGSQTRITRPGGCPNAPVGLVMHIDTRDGEEQAKFFDSNTSSIGLLIDKGVKDDFFFGFDWHWRAETLSDWKERNHCPTKKWSEELRALHDRFSWQVLEVLPLPFVVVAGACARDGIRKRLVLSNCRDKRNEEVSKVRTIKVQLEHHKELLEFDLDFRNGPLRRIIVYIPHPAAGFFADCGTRSLMAKQLDAALNMSLWILEKTHKPDIFRQEYGSSNTNRRYMSAPLPTMYRYRQQEVREERILPLNEYEPSFVRWANKYLQRSAASILNDGLSLVKELVTKISVRKSIALHKREAKRRELRLAETQKSKGLQWLLPETKNVRLSRRKYTSKAQLEEQNDVASDIQKISMAIPLAGKNEIFYHEQPAQSAVLTSCTDAFESVDNCFASNIEGLVVLTSILGLPVHLVPHGDVTISRSYPLPPLKFRLTEPKAKEILAFDKKPTIHFSPYLVELRSGDTVLYQRTIERLLKSAPYGYDWLIQLVFELENLQQTTNDDKDISRATKSLSSTNFTQLGRSRDSSRPGEYLRQEFRLKLLRGANFKLTNNRMNILDIRICFPLCISDVVYITAEVVKQGEINAHYCGQEHENEDPGWRLSLKAQYETAESIREEYVRLKGKKNAMKLNSLTDVLEGRGGAWIAQQKRRYLKDYKGQRSCYTTQIESRRSEEPGVMEWTRLMWRSYEGGKTG